MDYKANDVDGKEHNRFSRVVINNPLNGTPGIICVEEKVLTLTNGMEPIIKEVGNLNFDFNPEEVFPVLDPSTGEPTGKTLTGAQIYAGIWSVVMKKAHDRDQAIIDARLAAEAAAAKAEQEAAEAAAKAAAEAEQAANQA